MLNLATLICGRKAERTTNHQTNTQKVQETGTSYKLKIRMSEDRQQQQVFEVVPQYPNLIARFDGEPDNEATFPDLDFIVPGLEKPLKLSRNTLAPVSQLVRGVLSCDRSKTQFEWPFDTKNHTESVCSLRRVLQ